MPLLVRPDLVTTPLNRWDPGPLSRSGVTASLGYSEGAALGLPEVPPPAEVRNHLRSRHCGWAQALSTLQTSELEAHGRGFKALRLGGVFTAPEPEAGLPLVLGPSCPPGSSSLRGSSPSGSQRCLAEATTEAWGPNSAGRFGDRNSTVSPGV